MAEETPEERQERELEKLDHDENQQRDEETEDEREIRPGGDSTPQSPEWTD